MRRAGAPRPLLLALGALFIAASAAAQDKPVPPPGEGKAQPQPQTGDRAPAQPSRVPASVREQREAQLRAMQEAMLQQQQMQIQMQQMVAVQVAPGQFEMQPMVFDPATGQWVPQLPPMPTAAELAAVPLEPGMLERVRTLDAPGYEQREQAMRDLMAAQSDLMEIYAILTRVDLTLEQHYRLLAVVRDKLVFTPRGAVGISMRWVQKLPNEPGMIEIIDLLDGLPAREVLRLGDRIVKVDGQPLFSQNDMLMNVQNKRPGDAVMLTIRRPQFNEMGDPMLRDGEPVVQELDVKLALGSADRLQRYGGTNYSPVLADRQNRARAASIQYAPKTATIKVAPRPSRQNGAPSGQAFSAIESHPMIVRLRADLQKLANGAYVMNDELRDRWRTEREALARSCQAPGLDEQERDFRRRLFARYQELMPP